MTLGQAYWIPTTESILPAGTIFSLLNVAGSVFKVTLIVFEDGIAGDDSDDRWSQCHTKPRDIMICIASGVQRSNESS